ncbi:MAG TPA: superoxide dismutase [Candidatus Moranbacteria bacterium]|nr:superoxide dismutase [Candidatus Moranbacteria bacterium]
MYAKKEFSNLIGMAGFSDKLLETHFALYGGYVDNTNKILDMLIELNKDVPQYAEMKRRLGWEWNGIRLHEYYFENLGGNGDIDKEGNLYKTIEREFESFEKWKEDFIGTGKMRGIGWAVLYQDVLTGKLFNFWINEHDAGHPAGGNPILVLDVFEHAYMADYGKDRPAYIEAFMKNINWGTVEKRLR